MNYTKDNLGNKILVNELGDQVMMSWEKEYMKKNPKKKSKKKLVLV